jgi:hypothetical protein
MAQLAKLTAEKRKAAAASAASPVSDQPQSPTSNEELGLAGNPNDPPVVQVTA